MQARHFLTLVLLSALWGASFPFLRVATPAFGPWGLAALRCALATLMLAVMMTLLRQAWPARGAWPRLIFVSTLTIVAPFLLFNWAALVIPSGYSAILNTTVPLFSMLGAAAMGEERLNSRRLAGCALGFFGVVLLVRLGPVAVDWQVALAALACIVASACYGVGAIFMKRLTVTQQPLAVAGAAHLIAALLIAPPALLTVPQMQPTLTAWIVVAILGMITSGFMYWVHLRLMKEISASSATSAALMIPLFSVTWGSLFLGEPVTSGMLPGAVLVIGAAALVTGFNPFAQRR